MADSSDIRLSPSIKRASAPNQTITYCEARAVRGLIRDIDPLTLLRTLCKSGKIEETLIQHVNKMLADGENELYVNRIILDQLSRVTVINDLVCALTAMGNIEAVDNLILSIQSQMRTTSPMSINRVKIEDRLYVQKLFRDTKRSIQNAALTNKELLQTRMALIAKHHEETNLEEKTNIADRCIAILTAEIDAYATTYTDSFDKCDPFEELRKFIGESSNTNITLMEFNARLAHAYAIKGQFDQAEKCFNEARYSSQFVAPCQEMVNFLFLGILVKLKKFEKLPTDELQQEMIELGKDGLSILEEEDEDSRTLWVRLIRLRVSCCLLGIGFNANILSDYEVTQEKLEQAEEYIKEIKPDGMEKKRQVLFLVVRSRILDLKHDLCGALRDMRKAEEIALESNFPEIKNVRSNREILEKKHNERYTQRGQNHSCETNINTQKTPIQLNRTSETSREQTFDADKMKEKISIGFQNDDSFREVPCNKIHRDMQTCNNSCSDEKNLHTFQGIDMGSFDEHWLSESHRPFSGGYNASNRITHIEESNIDSCGICNIPICEDSAVGVYIDSEEFDSSIQLYNVKYNQQLGHLVCHSCVNNQMAYADSNFHETTHLKSNAHFDFCSNRCNRVHVSSHSSCHSNRKEGLGEMNETNSSDLEIRPDFKRAAIHIANLEDRDNNRDPFWQISDSNVPTISERYSADQQLQHIDFNYQLGYLQSPDDAIHSRTGNRNTISGEPPLTFQFKSDSYYALRENTFYHKEAMFEDQRERCFDESKGKVKHRMHVLPGVFKLNMVEYKEKLQSSGKTSVPSIQSCGNRMQFDAEEYDTKHPIQSMLLIEQDTRPNDFGNISGFESDVDIKTGKQSKFPMLQGQFEGKKVLMESLENGCEIKQINEDGKKKHLNNYTDETFSISSEFQEVSDRFFSDKHGAVVEFHHSFQVDDTIPADPPDKLVQQEIIIRMNPIHLRLYDYHEGGDIQGLEFEENMASNEPHRCLQNIDSCGYSSQNYIPVHFDVEQFISNRESEEPNVNFQPFLGLSVQFDSGLGTDTMNSVEEE